MVPDCEREGLRVACPKAATSRSATVSPPGRLTTDAALITVNGQIAHIVDMSNESSHNISVVGSTFARPLALINGRVRTMGRGGGTAILLANGRVVRVGTDDDIRALAGAEVDVIDLAGRAVIPGLIDAHAHLLSLGLVFRASTPGTHRWRVSRSWSARLRHEPDNSPKASGCEDAVSITRSTPRDARRPDGT